MGKCTANTHHGFSRRVADHELSPTGIQARCGGLSAIAHACKRAQRTEQPHVNYKLHAAAQQQAQRVFYGKPGEGHEVRNTVPHTKGKVDGVGEGVPLQHVRLES